ncbi:hypothetical protein [Saccharibacillus kuerlensis]|uniref:STAS domain-containing protein n=1 Tax=Saccharibacillus kuerlensis TaxID=459527 RepID=A0ABQ2L2D3_9BACL|nr:hypothetical protein [Saccharibacillus kuerlensis]GGN98468.1 hypothetical protein GCM10010969_17620 [Saccharibacillus kuerlensis]
MTEKFNVEVDKTKKLFIATVGGFFQMSDAEGFAFQFMQAGSQIQSSEYTLVVNAHELATVKQDLLDLLEQAFKMYMTLGFKKIYMVESKSAITSLQIRKIAEKTNFSGILVKSMDEVK